MRHAYTSDSLFCFLFLYIFPAKIIFLGRMNLPECLDVAIRLLCISAGCNIFAECHYKAMKFVKKLRCFTDPWGILHPALAFNVHFEKKNKPKNSHSASITLGWWHEQDDQYSIRRWVFAVCYYNLHFSNKKKHNVRVKCCVPENSTFLLTFCGGGCFFLSYLERRYHSRKTTP